MKEKQITPEEEFDIFSIDLNLLDKEWIQQPKTFFHFSCMLEEAEKRERSTSAHLKEVEEELLKKMRANPKKYGLEKLTETAISGLVVLEPEYKTAFKKLNQRKYRTGITKAVVNSLNQRKSALERLVELQARNYFSLPQTTDENTRPFKDRIENRVFQSKKKRKS